ncbi:MAG: heavy-metal-associated domain-containing protein [Firmicutes bacterium]|nr:heavy-metal-associated domain-containing protein [Bacillota bacterium]
MKKTLVINGMVCRNCALRIEDALNALPGVSAVTDLDAKTAEVTIEEPIPDEKLLGALSYMGYEVNEIRE